MTRPPIPADTQAPAFGRVEEGALYNEHEPYAAAWISNLAAAGHVAPGRIDTRSIVDLRPADLDGVAQFHAFAGIAGWSLALRLAGVPDDFPVWTGSCPCQPFSLAGRQRGFDDERHLWPAWFRLIRECRPAIVLGEQVEAAVRLGWLDAVFADLEGEGYACGAAVLGAHSVGAPHIRQRVWFVADAERCGRRQELHDAQAGQHGAPRSGGLIALADMLGTRLEGRDARSLGDERATAERGDAARILADADLERRDEQPACLRWPGSAGRHAADHAEADGRRPADPWADLVWLPCRDGKSRPTQPGLQPLAHGVPARVGKLRAAGNAIVPQVAAEFIAAALDLAPPSTITDPSFARRET